MGEGKDKIGWCMKHIVDSDTLLSEEEKVLVDESFKHEKEGKLVSISEFRQQ